jgi:hypothetical protein
VLVLKDDGKNAIPSSKKASCEHRSILAEASAIEVIG